MTIRAPAYELTIGSRRWTEQVLDIDVRLHAAPIPDVVTARFPANADLGASAGDRVVLRLDGGDGAREVFTGEVDALVGRLDGTIVVAIDAGGILARYRPAVTLEQATAATVIRALCDDAGVSAGTVDDGVQFAYYAAEPTRTAWEHVARVSGWGGAMARVDADGRVPSVVPGDGPADIALRHGRDVIALERVAARRRVESWVVAGEAGVGSADDPDALRPTTDFFGGSRPDGPGTRQRLDVRAGPAHGGRGTNVRRCPPGAWRRREPPLAPRVAAAAGAPGRGAGGDRRPPGPPAGRDVRRRVRAPCPRPMDRADAGPTHRGRGGRPARAAGAPWRRRREPLVRTGR